MNIYIKTKLRNSGKKDIKYNTLPKAWGEEKRKGSNLKTSSLI